MTESANSSVVKPSPIDCETAVRRLWDYLDGRLAATAHAEVEAHLAVCKHCPPHFTFARKIQEGLAASQAFELGEDDEARLRERVREALRRLS